jgi:hypothetical protein
MSYLLNPEESRPANARNSLLSKLELPPRQASSAAAAAAASAGELRHCSVMPLVEQLDTLDLPLCVVDCDRLAQYCVVCSARRQGLLYLASIDVVIISACSGKRANVATAFTGCRGPPAAFRGNEARAGVVALYCRYDKRMTQRF